MDRRRADGAPALWRRVRWANVGRLAVLLAAVFLVVSGGRACRTSSPPALPAPDGPTRAERRQRPLTEHTQGRPPKLPRQLARPRSRERQSDSGRSRRERRRPERRRTREPLEANVPEQGPAPPAAPIGPVVTPPPAPTPTPSAPATPEQSARPGEFTPDPGA